MIANNIIILSFLVPNIRKLENETEIKMPMYFLLQEIEYIISKQKILK